MYCPESDKFFVVSPVESPTVENADVTGAGDTVISALSLFFYKTGDISQAAEFANYAASVSVSKNGTAFPTLKDLKRFFNKNTIKQ